MARVIKADPQEKPAAAPTRRAERYAEAGDDIKVLALEVVRKIFGTGSRLSEEHIDAIVRMGIDELRARRKLRVQVPAERLEKLQAERPVLMGALHREPDLVVEAVADVSPGFARVVTEVGGALCTEQSALDQLAESIHVDETAVAPRPKSAVARRSDLRESEGDFEEFDDDFGVAEETAAAGLRIGDPQETHVESEEKPAGKIKVSGGLKPLEDDADPEVTQALDVSRLRKSFKDEEDDLDLYTDEAVD